MLGMTNVIESLNVLEKLVYTDKMLTIAEFKQAINDNYKGHEELLNTIINRVDHFGNCTESTNRLAARISDMVSAIRSLIEGFLKTEDAQMQFNIVSPDELLDAQIHPEKHGDLIVRIGGYSDYFTRIPKGLQDDVISRSMGD